MNDIVAIQFALYRGLRSCTLFNNFNVVYGREFWLQAEVQVDAIWLTPRNNFQGAGIIVQLPTLRFPKPNGLQRLRQFSICVYEERNLNFTPKVGSMTTAEDIADLVVDFGWNWRLWRSSGLILEDAAVVPDTRYPGIIGQSVQFNLRQERRQPARAATPVIDATDLNNVTLSVEDGSQIYFTTDGYSFPGPDNDGSLTDEQKATLYAAPFPVESGEVIQAAAFTDGLLPSQVATFEVP
jgi:hypothetical protein